MSLEVMTTDEIDEVSGAFNWFGLGAAVSYGWAFLKDIHFGYADMGGNYHSNPFPVTHNPISTNPPTNFLQVTGGL